MDWVWRVFVCMAVGSMLGVFWPFIIKGFRSVSPQFSINALNTASKATKTLVFLALGLFIGVAVAALSFATFLGDPANQTSLQELGIASYFLAFSAGFAAGALFEEPLNA
ncbi:hypothetical protein [Lentzea flava]|uniref:Uncharacterized protein n=1 Tax=Lentzea flava TaxID=103732 RepID=A0ABQ2VD94_9PSEU|nr:hypothetical protein [Lentzea flava]MCP2204807.1 hypothetical protein [Lentzea flava]GGU81142.1 hypothetical protein GCM10010178_84820 [Lentzea flava]